MPITSAAKKALKVNKRQRKENDITRAKVKGALKGARLAIENSEKDADKKISLAYRELDMASKKIGLPVYLLVGMVFGGLTMAVNLPRRESGTGTIPTFGSIVQNG